jgi:hypothetical protein
MLVEQEQGGGRSRLEREVMWVPQQGPGVEHLRLVVHDGTARADGLIIGLDDDQAVRVHYELHCDAAWCARVVRVTVLAPPAPTLHLQADGQGHWTDAAGQPVPALEGCLDVDLSATPFTNTLPIRRLALRPGESADLRVAYIAVPGLRVSAVRQRYGYLVRSSEGGRYRYESLPGEGLPAGFTDEVQVDADGLVITYPKLFRRVWSR